jgi:hypothetical protein
MLLPNERIGGHRIEGIVILGSKRPKHNALSV